MSDTTVIDPLVNPAPPIDMNGNPPVDIAPVDPVIPPAPVPDKPSFSPKTPAAPVTAKDKLRAFEDKNLGKDVPRIDGKVERGHGSPFKAMKPESHVEYAALEKQIDAEAKLADATAALETAKAALETAKTEVANTGKAAQAAANPPKTPAGL